MCQGYKELNPVSHREEQYFPSVLFRLDTTLDGIYYNFFRTLQNFFCRLLNKLIAWLRFGQTKIAPLFKNPDNHLAIYLL
jgi:hypothetical protein